MTAKEGDIYIHFPIECQINSGLISGMNMFSDRELNQDKTKVGYIHKSGRVRAVKLRDVLSEGILLPAKEIAEMDWSIYVGVQFDTIENWTICKKYIPEIKEPRNSGTGPKAPKVRIKDILIPGQFNFHYSTANFQKNQHKFQSEDHIVITDKWHGTSVVFANLLTKRKLSWWEWVKNLFGFYVEKQEYAKMYSSRSIIKGIDGKYNNKSTGYYKTDIYGEAFEQIKDLIPEGITLYAEIVGCPNQTAIQKGYAYQCDPGQFKIMIYRITFTQGNGTVREWPWEKIKTWCNSNGLTTVHELYNGSVADFCKEADLLETLRNTYLEKECRYNPGMPAEGVCIRNESTDRIAYKLKSKAFLLGETAALDAGQEVIE